MQGKEAFEEESTIQSSIGIDVSKGWLDVHVLPGDHRLRVPNNRHGLTQLKRWLKRFDVAVVVVEATGKWHRCVQRSLFAAGLPVAVVDPYRVRAFAKAQGLFAKTDRLDARVLAQFGPVMNPAVRAPAPQALEELAELVTARDSAVAEQTMLKNQSAAASTAFLRRQLKRRTAQLAKHIAALDGEIARLIAADPGLARRYAILTSIPGIGPVVAATLIAGLAELGSLTAKAAAMLAGLAPVANESGERQGVRVIWGGRAAVRRALYLAALTASRWNADLKAFYDRLLGKGKSAKLAIVAAVRKLVVLANTLIRDNRMWEPVAPNHA
jgi:transposase